MSRANKIKFGLKNVHVAIATVSEGGVWTYAAPVAVPGAVSLSLEAQGETTPFYADDTVYYRSTNNNGYEGDLELALIPEWFRTEILQESLDQHGVLAERADVQEQVKFALLFEFQGDQKATRHVLYNCTTTRPSVSSSTKEESVEPQTETLTLAADPRDDGLVKAKTGDSVDNATYNGWYTAVYVPVTNA